MELSTEYIESVIEFLKPRIKIINQQTIQEYLYLFSDEFSYDKAAVDKYFFETQIK